MEQGAQAAIEKQAHIRIVAGPNGAGKTTFAREYLTREADCAEFINADLIAAGLSPFAPERAAIQAGRLMLDTLERLVARGDSFSFETTLSGRGYARQIPAWREAGYRVELYFLSLPSADVAVERVRQRVRQGGHDISEETIRRRFVSGLALFQGVYKPPVDGWVLYDNSGDELVLKDWSDKSMIKTDGISEDRAGYAGVSAEASAMVQGSMAALRRAAQRARQIAEQTGTDLIVVRDGRITHVPPTRPRED